MAAFRGPLEHSGCGGSSGCFSERTPDGREYHVGSAITEEGARAIDAYRSDCLGYCLIGYFTMNSPTVTSISAETK